MITLPPLPTIGQPVLPPLPELHTEWFPIDGPDYVTPCRERSGYYELLPIDGGPPERKWFSGESANWMCVGGRVVWTIYKAWRGSVVPFSHPAPPPLPPLPAGIQGTKPKWLQLPLVAELPTLEERESMERAEPHLIELPGLGDGLEYFDAATGNTWTNRGRPPAWVRELRAKDGNDSTLLGFRIKRIKNHYYNVATGEQVAFVRGAK